MFTGHSDTPKKWHSKQVAVYYNKTSSFATYEIYISSICDGFLVKYTAYEPDGLQLGYSYLVAVFVRSVQCYISVM